MPFNYSVFHHLSLPFLSHAVSIATFSCDNGQVVDPLTCQADGSWSSEPPIGCTIQEWWLSDDGGLCSTTCANAGRSCQDGNWGVTDEATFRAAMINAGHEPAPCTQGFRPPNQWNGCPVWRNDEHYCYPASGVSSCAHSGGNAHHFRLCRCI